MSSKNYVDEKVTIWIRHHFSNDADMGLIVEKLEAGEDIIIDDLGFQECEDLCETQESLPVKLNGGAATLEVYSDTELIWDNSKKVKRKKLSISEKLKNSLLSLDVGKRFSVIDIMIYVYDLPEDTIEVDPYLKRSFSVLKTNICKELGIKVVTIKGYLHRQK